MMSIVAHSSIYDDNIQKIAKIWKNGEGISGRFFVENS